MKKMFFALLLCLFSAQDLSAAAKSDEKKEVTTAVRITRDDPWTCDLCSAKQNGSNRCSQCGDKRVQRALCTVWRCQVCSRLNIKEAGACIGCAASEDEHAKYSTRSLTASEIKKLQFEAMWQCWSCSTNNPIEAFFCRACYKPKDERDRTSTIATKEDVTK